MSDTSDTWQKAKMFGREHTKTEAVITKDSVHGYGEDWNHRRLGCVKCAADPLSVLDDNHHEPWAE